MKPLPIALIFSGYLLVYAAVAAGGKFATEPWAGLFADAYTETGKQDANPTPAPSFKGATPNTGRGVRTRGISTPVTPGPGR